MTGILQQIIKCRSACNIYLMRTKEKTQWSSMKVIWSSP